MIPKDVQRIRDRYRLVKKKMSKVRIGLPEKVVFSYKQGKVVCYPKQKKWIVTPKGKKPINHFIFEGRIDVTKYKARFFLKLAIINMLRKD